MMANSRTISVRSLTRLRDDRTDDRDDDAPEAVRPTTRGECQGGERPCPWVSCRYHMYLDVNPSTGSIKINFPDLEPWELDETCALDVADEGSMTLEEVGASMNVVRERARQMQRSGLAKVRAKLRAMGVIEESVPLFPRRTSTLRRNDRPVVPGTRHGAFTIEYESETIDGRRTIVVVCDQGHRSRVRLRKEGSRTCPRCRE